MFSNTGPLSAVMPARPCEPNTVRAAPPVSPFADRILEGYLPALVAFGLAAACPLLSVFMDCAFLAAALFFIYLLALLVASWCGRGPGLAVLVLTLLLPEPRCLGYTLAKADREVLVSLAAIWFLVSHVVSARRKAEVELRRYNEELDQRVREQTEALRERRAVPNPGRCHSAAVLDRRRTRADHLVQRTLVRLHGLSGGRSAACFVGPATRSTVARRGRETMARGDHSWRFLRHDDAAPLCAWQIPHVSGAGMSGKGRGRGGGALVRDEHRYHRAAADRRRTAQVERRAAGRANESLAQFAYISAHDLQEPLRTIVALELLTRRASDQLSDESREHVQLLVHAATRMSEMVSGMTTYSMLSGEAAQNRETVALDALFDELVDTMRGAIAGSGADVRRESLPVVEGDRPQLQQVFQNLLSNALKYRREGVVPEVRVRAERSGSEWRIAFRDNGQGFDQKYADRIFGMFQRLHGRDVPGSGVGLAVSKAVVERHGGSIWVESEPNCGTTFYFTLPVAAGTELLLPPSLSANLSGTRFRTERRPGGGDRRR